MARVKAEGEARLGKELERLQQEAAQAQAQSEKETNALRVAAAIGLPLSTTGMQAAVIALVALTGWATIAGWGIVRPTPLDGVLLLFYATLAVSALASGHPLEAAGWQPGSGAAGARAPGGTTAS